MPKPPPGANPEYILATGLAVTFMVTNKQNKADLVEAMEWEKKWVYEKRKVEGGIEHSLISSFRFVTYMANYSNELFDFAYSAERSIEDGIQELSDAEMSTVIISYVVMFVYITIALGKFKGFRHLLVSGGFS